jgi:hypothetical protein
MYTRLSTADSDLLISGAVEIQLQTLREGDNKSRNANLAVIRLLILRSNGFLYSFQVRTATPWALNAIDGLTIALCFAPLFIG